MSAPASHFDPPEGEPLALLESPHPAIETLAQTRARSLEFACRGDRVPLEILSPDPAPGGPVLLVQLRPESDAGLAGLAGLRTWLAAGIEVASITLPLFGSRRSPKMTAMLESAVAESAAGRAVDANARMLWQEFARQSVLELRRALDTLAELRGGAVPSVAFAGAGLAASVGAIFCAVDPRPVGAVLAGPGSHGPEGADPSGYLDEIAPRPLEILETEDADLLDAAWSFLGTRLSSG